MNFTKILLINLFLLTSSFASNKNLGYEILIKQTCDGLLNSKSLESTIDVNRFLLWTFADTKQETTKFFKVETPYHTKLDLVVSPDTQGPNGNFFSFYTINRKSLNVDSYLFRVNRYSVEGAFGAAGFVRLKPLSYEAKNNVVTLTYTTASELDNPNYIVQIIISLDSNGKPKSLLYSIPIKISGDFLDTKLTFTK